MIVSAMMAGGAFRAPAVIPPVLNAGFTFGGRPIALLGFTSDTSTLGSVTLLGLTSATTYPLYSVFINGVDRTNYTRVGAPTGPGISINAQSNSRATASFYVLGWNPYTQSENNPSQYIPTQLPSDTVEIRRNSDGLLMYRGFVDTMTYGRLWGPDYALGTQVNCVDAGILFDRIIVGMAFTGAPFTYFADYILTVVANAKLAGAGVSFVYSSNVNLLLGQQIFPYQSMTEVCNRIAQQTNTSWTVDEHNNLRFYDTTVGYRTDAPANIDDSTQLVDLTVNQTKTRFANRWYAKSNQQIGNAVTVDSTTVATVGWNLFILSQVGPGGDQVPSVTVNGVVKVVIASSLNPIQPDNTTWDFIYGGVTVVYNWRLAPLQPGDVVQIIYPSPLPWVAIAEDLASIAAVGLVEATVEAGDVKDKVTLQAIADEALARGKVVPKVLSYKTRTDGYKPGQLISVVRAELGINDNFLITGVASREIQQEFFEHTVTMTNGSAQFAADPNKFMADLIKNTRMTTYNIMERITFNLAVTIEGITNPGLTTGVKPAIKTAQKNGTAGWITLIFNSLSQLGQVTTSDIVIDVFQNAVSIFGTKKLTLPAGFSGEEKFSVFTSDPLYVSVGDVFTFQVTSADAHAMDGIMELVTVG